MSKILALVTAWSIIGRPRHYATNICMSFCLKTASVICLLLKNKLWIYFIHYICATCTPIIYFQLIELKSLFLALWFLNSESEWMNRRGAQLWKRIWPLVAKNNSLMSATSFSFTAVCHFAVTPKQLTFWSSFVQCRPKK